MIPMTLSEIADAVTGRLVGAPPDGVTVTAPAAIDSRDITAGGLFVALVGEHADGHDFLASAHAQGAAAALVAREVPGSPLPLVVCQDVTIAFGRLARHVHDRLSGPGGQLTTLAVTGSAGKTSTKDLLAHVLGESGPTIAPQGSFNNEWGVPLTVLSATEETRYLVVEMGARGIGHIADLCAIAPPDVATVLNVGSAHIGEFGGLELTARAKGEIFEALSPQGTAVINCDDPLVAAMRERTSAAVLGFGTGAEADVRLVDLTLDAAGFPEVVLEYHGERLAAVIPQLGLHHGLNAAAAVAMAVCADVPFASAVTRLGTAHARSAHRMARHDLVDQGITVIDDAYNANPESMRAAITWLAQTAGNRGIAVLGTMLELGPQSQQLHHDIGRHAAASGLRHVIAVGTDASAIAEGAGSIGVTVTDVTEAVEMLRQKARSEDVILIKASRGCRLERVVTALTAD